MIFATVGTQLPFPRMIKALDGLALSEGFEIFAQTADPEFKPASAITTSAFLTPDEYRHHFLAARVIVSHAGIGTVLAARESLKPIIIMPRKAALGEHRNDHQMATAKRLAGTEGIYVANTDMELESFLKAPDLRPASEVSKNELPALSKFIKDIIFEKRPH